VPSCSSFLYCVLFSFLGRRLTGGFFVFAFLLVALPQTSSYKLFFAFVCFRLDVDEVREGLRRIGIRSDFSASDDHHPNLELPLSEDEAAIRELAADMPDLFGSAGDAPEVLDSNAAVDGNESSSDSESSDSSEGGQSAAESEAEEEQQDDAAEEK